MIRKQTFWILVALGALFVAACSSGGDSSGRDDDGASGGGDVATLSRDSFSSDVNYVESVAQRTGDIESYQFEMVFGMDGVPEIGSMSFTAEGAIDAPRNRMHMSMDLSSLFDAAPAGTSDEELAMMRELLGDGTFEFIVDGETAYMKLGFLGALFGADTEWISFSDPEVGNELDLGGLGLGQVGMDPATFFELFGGVGTIEEDGRFVIRGVETTRFSGTIDLAAALDAAPASERDQLEAQLADLDITGLGAMPVSVWVDDDGYMRKFEMTFDLSQLGAPGTAGSMSIAMELFNFGDAVSIEIPSSDDVTEIDENSLFGGPSFGESSY